MTLKVHILGHWRSLLSPAADYEGQFGKLENPKKGNDQVVGPCPPALPGPLTEELGSRVSRRALTHSLTHTLAHSLTLLNQVQRPKVTSNLDMT